MSQQFKCPKCPGYMRTYTRAGIQIEQCDNCRGIFLDYGELEQINRFENQWNQPAQQAAPPPAPPAAPAPGYVQPAQPVYQQPVQPVYVQQPAWGGHYGSHGHYKHKSFGKMLFSS